MIKALIVEDEDLAYKRLEALVNKITSDIEIIGRTIAVEDTLMFLQNNTVDLMFLDINLSDGYSFTIFEKSHFKTPPIIFTTAYSEHAIRAFEHNSISYILKPIKEEELNLAIEKYRYLSSKNLGSSNSQDIDYRAIFESITKPYKEKFLIKSNKKLQTIEIKDISYFFSEDKLTFIMLKNGKTKPIDYTLKSLESQLDPKNFYRINRKYLIHYNSIKEMYYTSKSKIKVELNPKNPNDSDMNFVAIEKLGSFKKWLAE